MCSAPTGRAARRMEESTGVSATTIHKALGLIAGEDGNYCEPEQLEADLILVDEVSMMDIYLAGHLLYSIPQGSQLVLIGDVDQLPSVGPGAVLKSLIDCGKIPVVRLEKVYRQALGSRIATNAKLIRSGNLGLEYGEDFQLFESSDLVESANLLEEIYLQEAGHYGVDNVTLLTPFRQKTDTGVNALNSRLQSKVNPPEAGKPELSHGKRIFRLGDKVMQVKNNYQLEWEILGRNKIPVDKGVGVFIGYTGIMTEINEFAETATVEFEDGRFAMYSFKQLEELELAYAITIHKSQGSEYPAVILPLLSGPQMLLNRNLLYTAVTRARKCVTVVGKEETFAEMIRNEKQQKRYSALDERIRELSETTGDNNTDGEE